MIPIWGSGKEALADWEDEDYLGAVANLGLAVSDVFLAKAIVTGLLKGGLKMSGTHVWENKPWESQSVRQWMGKKGFLKDGEHGHHWLIPQRSKIPDWIKNQPPNIMPLDRVTHGRVHGRYPVDGQKLPQFNLGERLLYGTPGWAKAATGSSAGHGLTATQRAIEEQPPPRHRR